MTGSSNAFNLLKSSTLGEILSVQATRFANRPFLQLRGQRWTYAEVEFQAAALAAGLRQIGLQPGERLAICLPNVPQYVVSIFAAAKAGLIVVPVNVRHDAENIANRLARTGARAVITFSAPQEYHGKDHLALITDLRPELADLEHIISITGEGTLPEGVHTWDALLMPEAPLPAATASPHQTAAIIHTLGRLGQPHGAMLTHEGLLRNAASLAAVMECGREDVFLGTVPFSNTFGLTATILACMLSGAELVCLPRYNPAEALDLIAKTGVTVHHGVPTMFALEINHPAFKPADCASLRTGIMSGAPCPPDLVREVRQKMGFNLLIAYGLTEASPGVTITRLDDGPVTATETVGRPLEGVEIKVIDEQGQALPPGEEGELCVRGYNVMLGYWNDPQTTSRVLDEDSWLHTGDLAIIDPDGPVRIVGRKGDIIIRGGFKIHPDNVEMVLRLHPQIKDVAVVGVPDLLYGELLYACVVPQPGSNLREDEILAFAESKLSDYAMPDRIIFFDMLPRRGSAIQRDYLRQHVRIRGHAWKFGRNIDTDAIIPARRCNTADPHELARYCMEDADPEFVNKMRRGDLIVADANFGCGSSREVAPLAIKAAGVSAVIAKSFARIFFRNAINIGLPIFECPAAVDGIQEGDEVEVEPMSGRIHNLTRGEVYQAEPFPEFLQRIIERGGLLAYVEERLNAQTAGGSDD